MNEHLYFYSFTFQAVDGLPPAHRSGTKRSNLPADDVLEQLIQEEVPEERRGTVNFLAFNTLPND